MSIFTLQKPHLDWTEQQCVSPTTQLSNHFRIMYFHPSLPKEPRSRQARPLVFIELASASLNNQQASCQYAELASSPNVQRLQINGESKWWKPTAWNLLLPHLAFPVLPDQGRSLGHGVDYSWENLEAGSNRVLVVWWLTIIKLPLLLE